MRQKSIKKATARAQSAKRKTKKAVSVHEYLFVNQWKLAESWIFGMPLKFGVGCQCRW